MNRILLAFLFFSTSLSMNSQEFAPPGAEWHYYSISGWSSGGHHSMKYVGDTVFNGSLRKIIHVSATNVTLWNEVQTWEYLTYISQSGDSIFRHYDVDYAGEYAFKINYEVGETIYFSTNDSQNDQFVVENLDTLWFDSQMIRRFKLRQIEHSKVVHVYDLFGPDLGFLENWWMLQTDGTDFLLKCYADDNLPLVNLGNGSCNTLSSERISPTISIFPNPAFQYIEIQGLPENITQAQLLIFNSLGTLIYFENIEQTEANMKIEIAHLPPGIYWGILQDSHTAISFRFAKTQ